MIVLVLSDLHLGKGKFLSNGQLNLLEDFFENDRFCEFLEYYSTGDYFAQKIHLILNGDILNLIQIDIEGVFTHIIDEALTVRALDLIYQGHNDFFKALKSFIEKPNKEITYVIGNHDSGMAFRKAQERFIELTHPDIQFCFELQLGGVHIEHGHRFEAINSVAPKDYFVDGPNGKKILHLPWGSLFCISVLPLLKKDRPFLDRIRPISSYIKWCFFNDISFFARMSKVVLRYFYETRLEEYTATNRHFKTTIKLLRQLTIYPVYEKMAKRILKRNKLLHTVVMGHTHMIEWRRFPEGKYYFNTGTWNAMPSIDAGLHEDSTKLTYVKIELSDESLLMQDACVNIWQGNWKPFLQEASLRR
jgi:UDP-2,3-diacylglucosamine pyrophosphatase LpxH